MPLAALGQRSGNRAQQRAASDYRSHRERAHTRHHQRAPGSSGTHRQARRRGSSLQNAASRGDCIGGQGAPCTAHHVGLPMSVVDVVEPLRLVMPLSFEPQHLNDLNTSTLSTHSTAYRRLNILTVLFFIGSTPMVHEWRMVERKEAL